MKLIPICNFMDLNLALHLLGVMKFFTERLVTPSGARFVNLATTLNSQLIIESIFNVFLLLRFGNLITFVVT